MPNALAFASDIVDNLLNEKSIILNCSKGFPWYSHLAMNIKESVKRQNSSKRFEHVSDESDPGAYLLREFCKPGKRADYRPTKSYAQFFAESDDIVLHERYMWVKIGSKEQLDSWTGFVSEYVKKRGRNRDIAVFILEWAGEGTIQTKKGIKVCSFDEYVSEYDRIVFCTLAASAVRERPFIKNYLTELTANVVGNDIELCALCLENYREFLADPYMAIDKIIVSKVRSDGGEFHFEKSQAEVDRLIWLAQIRTVYPALEEYREGFVHHYASVIAKQLPITSSCGEVYRNPEEVELGTLKYMADNGWLNLNQKEYDRLRLNKNVRNKLSHLTPLMLDEVKQLEL